MGLFGFFKKKPTAATHEAERPVALPCPATIATLTPDGVGTLALPGGRTLRFGASACQGFLPAIGLSVEVTATGPHPLGGLRATSVTLQSTEATYRARLGENMAAMEPRASSPAPAPTPTPPARPSTGWPIDFSALDSPPAPGKRRLLAYRFEDRNRFEAPELFFREVTLDERVVREVGAKAHLSEPLRATHFFYRSAARHRTVSDARAAFERLVAQAWRDFPAQHHEVREVDGPARQDVAPAARHAELEAALEDAVEPATVSASARVLADWLQSNGDPRGELAALHQQGKLEEAEAFLSQHAQRLLGEADVALESSEVYELRWRHGFLQQASLRRNYDSPTDLATLTAGFLALPLARFVTELRFGLASYDRDNDWAPTLRAVAESPRAAQLRALRFDDYTSEDCEISWTAFGDFSPFWSKLPALEWLHIRSGEGGNLGELDLPRLKTFIRESGGLSADEIRAVLQARWPLLERLDLWLGSTVYGAQGSVGLLRPLLDGDAPTGLRHLGLVNCEFSQDLFPALLTSPLLPRLEVLDLSKGVLVDADVQALLQNPQRIRHLKRIDLSKNLLSESVEALATALPNVILDEQRFDEIEECDGARTAAVGE